MPEYAPIMDHADEGVALLLAQFRDKPRLEALLQSFLAEVQELENQAFAVAAYRQLDLAFGVQLDILGAIVGEGRNGRTDESYRNAIRVRILINDSDGQVETLIAIADLYESVELNGGSVVVKEYQPAALTVTLLDHITVDASGLVERLRQAKAAGVRLDLVYLPTGDVTDSFTLSDASSPSSDPDTGLGDTVSPPTGGALTGVA